MKQKWTELKGEIDNFTAMQESFSNWQNNKTNTMNKVIGNLNNTTNHFVPADIYRTAPNCGIHIQFNLTSYADKEHTLGHKMTQSNKKVEILESVLWSPWH